MTSGRNQSYSALRYHQEQFKNAAQEHQRVAYEQVEIAAALATSRTAAHSASRFRDIMLRRISVVNKRGLLSELASESAQALEGQRHSLFQEATAGMMRRDTCNLPD